MPVMLEKARLSMHGVSKIQASLRKFNTFNLLDISFINEQGERVVVEVYHAVDCDLAIPEPTIEDLIVDVSGE